MKWLRALISLGLVLLGYTLWTLFNSQSDLFKAESGYGSVQIAVSKFLVFSVLAYGVLACAKNYQSHRHNSVVNKHRQNALMTFRTFTESGGTLDARDTILNHAAAAIYAPVDSGYVRNEERGYGSSMPSMTLGGRSIPGSAAE